MPGKIPQSGVLWNGWSDRWEAWICLNHRSFFLGQYESSEQAVHVYNAAMFNHYHSAVQGSARAVPPPVLRFPCINYLQ